MRRGARQRGDVSSCSCSACPSRCLCLPTQHKGTGSGVCQQDLRDQSEHKGGAGNKETLMGLVLLLLYSPLLLLLLLLQSLLPLTLTACPSSLGLLTPVSHIDLHCRATRCCSSSCSSAPTLVCLRKRLEQRQQLIEHAGKAPRDATHLARLRHPSEGLGVREGVSV